MDASTVYQVAQALSKEELAKLYDMLKLEIYPISVIKKKNNQIPEFSDEDALEYLLNKFEIF